MMLLIAEEEVPYTDIILLALQDDLDGGSDCEDGLRMGAMSREKR